MATRTKVQLVCDEHGKDCGNAGVRTRLVGVDGRRVAVELCDVAALPLVRLLEVGRPKPPEVLAQQRVRRPRRDTEEIRAWARKNGYQVGERGRFSAEVLEAYSAARQESRA